APTARRSWRNRSKPRRTRDGREGAMLRRWLIGLGGLYLLGALLLFAAFGAVIPGIYLLVGGAVLLGGIVFERSRYRPRIDRERGDWQATGERFVDPSRVRLVDVHCNLS